MLPKYKTNQQHNSHERTSKRTNAHALKNFKFQVKITHTETQHNTVTTTASVVIVVVIVVAVMMMVVMLAAAIRTFP